MALLFVVFVAFHSGCSTPPPVTNTQYQDNQYKVAVVAVAQEPKIQFEGFARGKTEGAAKGAGAALVECLGNFSGGCSGTLCGGFYIIYIGFCGTASMVGGVIGAAVAPSAQEVRAVESTASTALEAETIQNSLRDQIVAAALANGMQLEFILPASAQDAARQGNYRPLSAEGVETVLEVVLNKVGTEGSGINPPLAIVMEAHVRLIRTDNNAEIFSANYVYHGEKRKLAEWSANQAERLLRALNSGYESLGAHIYENVFQLYPFPDRKAQWTGILEAAFGLAPIAPSTRGMAIEDPLFSSFYWTKVDQIQPTLSWQQFPRTSDIRKAPEEMGRVRNVRYDLVIAREHNFAPAEVVYRREGLPGNVHTIKTALSPATRYYWTVRARFDLDGRKRVTEWGSISYMVREQMTAPSQWSYRFRTP